MDVEILTEIMYITCRNRQPWQIDHFGKCFTEEDIEDAVKDYINCIICHRSKPTKERVIRLAQTVVEIHEANLYTHTLAAIQEYGR